jgi:capsule polysaccharide modification protein KpsS
MNWRWSLIAGVLLAAALPPGARATPAVTAQAEIDHLLDFVESSGCEFYRNGSWYDSKQARAHLRYKYDALMAADRIQTAEDFIEKAATKSSVSGRVYEIRCNGGTAVATGQWLREELARYRTTRSHYIEAHHAQRVVCSEPASAADLRIFSRLS